MFYHMSYFALVLPWLLVYTQCLICLGGMNRDSAGVWSLHKRAVVGLKIENESELVCMLTLPCG